VTPRPEPEADPPTPPSGRAGGAPTPPFGTPEVPTTPEATPIGRRPRRAPRRTPDPLPARRHVPGPATAARTATARRRLVGVARVLAGGLVVLTLAVVAGPWLLDGPGAGGAVIVGHLVGAAVAVVATAVAAHPRTPPAVGVLAALAVPVDVLVVLGTYWWA
jgi:hypothetical protein